MASRTTTRKMKVASKQQRLEATQELLTQIHDVELARGQQMDLPTLNVVKKNLTQWEFALWKDSRTKPSLYWRHHQRQRQLLHKRVVKRAQPQPPQLTPTYYSSSSASSTPLTLSKNAATPFEGAEADFTDAFDQLMCDDIAAAFQSPEDEDIDMPWL